MNPRLPAKEKKQSLRVASESDIFQDAENEIRDLVDQEEVVNIDVEDIDSISQEDAQKMIDDISKLYFDEEFIKKQPNFKNRIDSELESLRINIKMRKADEVAHDILLKNIGRNPSNASMYKSLTEIQKTIVSITTKIEETITRLQNMMKNYQMEFNFDNNESSDETNDGQDSPPAPVGIKKSYKGSKAFIEAMSNLDDDDVDVPEDDDE